MANVSKPPQSIVKGIYSIKVNRLKMKINKKLS